MTQREINLCQIGEILGRETVDIERNMPRVEYDRWLKFFEWRLNAHEKQDYYMAQIAAMHGAKGTKFKDFLIEFKSEEETVKMTGQQMANLLSAALGAKTAPVADKQETKEK